MPFALLFLQGANPKTQSVRLTVLAAIPINISLWVARALVVISTFYHPLSPWRMALYSPTFAECGMVIGSFFFFGLLLLLMIKLLPVLELPEAPLEESQPVVTHMPVWKAAATVASTAGGISLIASGILLRDSMEAYHSPAIWISGIIVLVTVPLQLCFFRRPACDGRLPHPENLH